MKHRLHPLLSAILPGLAMLFLTTCERDWNNPWDEFNNLSPEAWAPQNLQIEDVSITEKKLTWTYGDYNIEGFKIDRKKGNDTWQVAYQSLTKETRNWSDTEIIPDPSLTFEYRLYAFAGKQNSAHPAVSTNVDFAPTNLWIEKLSDKSYKLTWSDNSIGEQGFKIDRKIDEGNWATTFGTVSANQTTFIDTNVFRATSVEYRVYGFYENYESSKTSIATSAVLVAPEDLQIEKLSDKSFELSWTDNSDGEEGYKIDRRVDNGDWVASYGDVAANQVSFVDTNVFRAVNIEYLVYAFAGNSESQKIAANTNAELTAPTNLAIIQNSITSVTLNWQDNSNGEEGFRIDRKYEGGDWQILTTTKDNHFEDNGFELNTQVYYRVCTFLGLYFSSWVEKDFVSQIPAPTNLQITPNLINSVTLTWQDNSIGEEGYKIDKKLNSGAWELNYAIVSSNQTSFIDNNLNWQTLNDIYYYRVYAFVGLYNSSEIENSFSCPCGFPFIDARDNNIYETVSIGDQCWMKENLAYLSSVSTSSNGSQTSPYYYVYGYQGTSVNAAKATANYQTYGVLYNWPASLTACPNGWHLPSDAEWTTLTTYLGGESVAGGKMKETGTTHWQSPNTGATNSSGFTGLPGGYRYTNGTFYGIGFYGYFWSSSESSATYAWGRYLDYNSAVVGRNYDDKGYGFSVRCLRD